LPSPQPRSRQEVVAEELYAIVAVAAQLFDPSGRRLVVPSAVCTRNLSICDVLDQGVRERELGLPGNRRPASPAHQLALNQLVQY
jgi:hypothetical protein